MTQVEQLAAFAVQTRYEDLSEEARHQLKIHILDAFGCAFGAIDWSLGRNREGASRR